MTRQDADRLIAAALSGLPDEDRAYLSAPPGVDPGDFADFPSVTLKPYQVAVVRFALAMAVNTPALSSINMRVQPAGTVFGTLGFHAWTIVQDINRQIEYSGKRPDDVER